MATADKETTHLPGVAFLVVFLYIQWSDDLRVVSAEPINQPAWAGLVDIPLNWCHTDTMQSMNQENRRFHGCVARYRIFIGCLPLDNLAGQIKSNQKINTMPCGRFEITPAFIIKDAIHKVRWAIVVPFYLHLNLTFHKFHLPMPYGKCDDKGSVEKVFIAKYTFGVNYNDEDLHLCGQRNPFSLKLAANDVLVEYSCIKPSICFGEFLLQYQVCDPVVCDHQAVRPVQLIEAYSQKHYTTVLSRPYAEQYVFFRVYSLHVVVNRMSYLKLLLAFGSAHEDKSLSITIYDGPYPSRKHAHPSSDIPDNERLINFITFQGYVQIECLRHTCEGIILEYTQEAHTFSASSWRNVDEVDFQMRMTSTDCSGVSLSTDPGIVYCMWQLQSLSDTNTLTVLFQALSLGQADAVGDQQHTVQCPLSGVTVVDERKFKKPYTTGRDTLFPEITMCTGVPFVGIDNHDVLQYDLPMREFTSTSSRIIVLIYAYGGLVNLEKINVTLLISHNNCVGLIVACPVINTNSLTEIGSFGRFNGEKTISRRKQTHCSDHRSKLALFTIRTVKADFSLVYCTTHVSPKWPTTKAIILLDIVREDVCLIMQYHPYFTPKMTLACQVNLDQTHVPKNMQYTLNSVLPWSGICARLSSMKQVTYKTYSNRSQTGEFLRLVDGNAKGITPVFIVQGFSACYSYQLKAEFVDQTCLANTLLGSDYNVHVDETLVIQDLQGAQKQQHSCQSYSIQATPTKAIFSVSVINQLTAFAVRVHRTVEFDAFSAYETAENLGRIRLKISASLNRNCPVGCKRVLLCVAYEEIATGAYVILKWTLEGIYPSVFVDQIAFGLWVLYLSFPGRFCLTDSCILYLNVLPSIQFIKENSDVFWYTNSVMPHDIFVQYNLLWTTESYTWQQAEDLCQSAGMHLASISSELEYDIVSGLLAGAGYRKAELDSSEMLINTPCRIESTLCMVYIGLQRNQVKRC